MAGTEKFAHVCLLVRDIRQAIDDYRRILAVVDPQQLTEPTVFYEDFGVGDERLSFATFVSPGCEIQLMQPLTPGTPLYRRMERLGEHVHHICFTSEDVRDVARRLVESEVGIVEEGISRDPNLPWQEWTFVNPALSHGVLIEIAYTYRSVGGRWEPAAGS